MDFGTIIISVVGAAIVSWITAKYTTAESQRRFLTEHNKAKTEKAIDLAEKYCKEIMPYVNYFSYFQEYYEDIKPYHKIISEKRFEGELTFSQDELYSLFDKEAVEKIEEYSNPENMPTEIFLNARNISGLRFYHIDGYITPEALERSLGEIEDIDLKLQFMYEFYHFRSTVLNNLESFAMYFNGDIANKDFVYQSLHQTFLGLITYFYFYICLRNDDPKDHYFVNLISLYNEWNKKYSDKIKLEQAHEAEKDVINEQHRKEITEDPKPFHAK